MRDRDPRSHTRNGGSVDDEITPTPHTVGNGERDYYERELRRAYVVSFLITLILFIVILVLTFSRKYRC